MRRHLIALGLMIAVLPLASHAQSLTDSLSSGDPFSVSITPEYPTPNSSVSLSFLSAQIDLTDATLTVTSGGKQLYTGSVHSVSIPLKGTGKAVTVTVKIASAGTTYTKTVVVQPQDVSLVVEPLSSAPPLYPGKPLVPLGGNVRVIAVADFRDAAGKRLDPKTLSYAWTVDGMQIADSSGIGKDAVVVASALKYRSRSVSVVVKNQGGGLLGGSDVILSGTEPSVRIYENDPLLGVRFEHALSGTYTLSSLESSLYAAPFSFPLTPAPALSWILNGASAQTGSILTLRSAGNGQGSASLSLTASSGTLGSSASASLSLLFGTKDTANIFGL